MRIGLNATCFNERPSGARQRFVGIYGELIRRCSDIEFVIYEPRDCAVAAWFGGVHNVRAVRTPLLSTRRWHRTIVGIAYWRQRLIRDNLDLFETFHLPLVRAPLCPTVLTVHDARPILPDVPRLQRMVAGRLFRGALRSAKRVITVSRTMKRELAAIEPSSQISTVYNGIDPRLFAPTDQAADEAVGKRLGAPDDFIIAVGHFEARKNYPKLVEALAILRARRPDLGLVIVGNDGGELTAITRLIQRLKLSASIRLLQGVSDDDLSALYRMSKLVVFPSTYEGFGIPVLEAMATRRPLVLSDLPVFIELTEGQGAYFPPDDAAAMAGAIAAVLGSPGRQRELIDYGDRRIGEFDFAYLSAQVEALYRSLIRDSAA